MKVRTLVVALQCGFAGLVAGPATASTPEKPTLVQQVKDPASGLDVRVFVGGKADVSIEVGDRTVQIQKQLVRGASVTRLTTAAEQLTLVTDTRRMTVDGTLGHAEAASTRLGGSDAVRRILERSTAVERAIALLGRLNLGPRSPIGHALLTTRAMLMVESGDPAGADELARWLQSARRALIVKPVSLDSGPGDCWDEYTKEAIAAYMEFEDCLKGVKWYDVGREFTCGTLYDLRAIGAFSWYLHCVALKS